MGFGRILLSGGQPLREAPTFTTPRGVIRCSPASPSIDVEFTFAEPAAFSRLKVPHMITRLMQNGTDQGPLTSIAPDWMAAVWANSQGGVFVYHAGDTVELVGWGAIGAWMQTPLVSNTFSPAIWGLYEQLFGQRLGFLAAGLDGNESIVHTMTSLYAAKSLWSFHDPLLAAGLYVDLQYRDICVMACDICRARDESRNLVGELGGWLRQTYDTGTSIPDVPRLPDAERAASIAAAVERHPSVKWNKRPTLILSYSTWASSSSVTPDFSV